MPARRNLPPRSALGFEERRASSSDQDLLRLPWQLSRGKVTFDRRFGSEREADAVSLAFHYSF